MQAWYSRLGVIAPYSDWALRGTTFAGNMSGGVGDWTGRLERQEK